MARFKKTSGGLCSISRGSDSRGAITTLVLKVPQGGMVIRTLGGQLHGEAAWQHLWPRVQVHGQLMVTGREGAGGNTTNVNLLHPFISCQGLSRSPIG